MAEEGESAMQALVDGLCGLDYDSAVTVMTSVLHARPELAPAVVGFSVPDLTYPPSKALIERRSDGYIKSFNQEKGFGFIECQELFDVFGNDVFVHHSQAGGWQPGQAVSFAVMLNKENRPQAYDLQTPSAGKGGGGMGGGMGMGMGGGGGMGKKGGGCAAGGWGGKGNGAAAGTAFPALKGGAGAMGMMKGGKKGGKGDDFGKRKGCWGAAGAGAGAAKGAAFCGDDATHIGDFEGMIKSYNQVNGYGFIECQDIKDMYGNDTFLHKNDLGTHEVGEWVSFAAFVNTLGKPQAKNLQVNAAAKRQKFE